jgi:hypothetical protein
MYDWRIYDLKNKFKYLLILGRQMYNLISFNNLRGMMVQKKPTEEFSELDKISEYFECITDCDVHDSSCRSYCRHILD